MKRVSNLVLLVALTLLPAVTLAQTGKSGKSKTRKPVPVLAPAIPAGPVQTESLSGLDLLPNRHTGQFAIRIRHRFSQPATFKLTNTQTGQVMMSELLQPSAQTAHAFNAGRLGNGEYKMEVLLPDTVYWKTVRVTH